MKSFGQTSRNNQDKQENGVLSVIDSQTLAPFLRDLSDQRMIFNSSQLSSINQFLSKLLGGRSPVTSFF